MQSELTAIGKLLASTHRLRVMNVLAEALMTPTQIARSLNITMPYASKVIHQLETLGLVECITPELRKGRLYSLTNIGRKTLDDLRAITKRSKDKENDRA